MQPSRVYMWRHTTLARSTWTSLAAAVMCTLLTSGSVSARTWTVAKDGSGDFGVIQDAEQAAAPGDTILVFPGRYEEFRPYNFGALVEDTYVVLTKSDITLRGMHRDSVIIGPTEHVSQDAFTPNGIAMDPHVSGARIENLTVENVAQGIVVENWAEVRDLRISDCYMGLSIWSLEYSEFERIEIHESRDYGFACWRPAVGSLFNQIVCVGDDSNVLFSRVVGVQVLDCVFDSETYVSFQSSSVASVRRCTIRGGLVAISGSSVELRNNTIGPDAGVGMQVQASHVWGEGNDFLGGQQATMTFGTRATADLSKNQILNTSPLSVYVYKDVIPADGPIDLRGNWWGTTDAEQIAAWIIDVNDDAERIHEVLFEPYAEDPVSEKPSSMGGLKSRFRSRN